MTFVEGAGWRAGTFFRMQRVASLTRCSGTASGGSSFTTRCGGLRPGDLADWTTRSGRVGLLRVSPLPLTRDRRLFAHCRWNELRVDVAGLHPAFELALGVVGQPEGPAF